MRIASPGMESAARGQQSQEGKQQILASRRVEVGRQVTLEVLPRDGSEEAFLGELRRAGRPRVAVAFGNTAILTRLTSANQSREGREEKWTLVLAPEETDYGAGFMEMSTSGYSANDLAELRARRILLDEKLPGSEKAESDMGAALMETLVRGILFRSV